MWPSVPQTPQQVTVCGSELFATKGGGPLTLQEEIFVATLRDRHLLNLEFAGLDKHALRSDGSRYGMTHVLTAL